MFILPLHRSSVEQFCADETLPKSVFERAALCLAILTANSKTSPLPRALKDLNEHFALLSEFQTIDQFKVLVPQELNIDKLEQELFEVETCFAPSWIVLPQIYDFDFQDQFKMGREELRFHEDSVEIPFDESDSPRPSRNLDFTGTSEQILALQSINGGTSDEHFFVTAFAGTGKSHLIETLVSHSPWPCTYLAPFYAHRFGIEMRFSEQVRSKLRVIYFGELLDATLKANLPTRNYLMLSLLKGQNQKIRSAKQRAETAGLPRIGDRSASQVLEIIEETIMKFSRSADDQISDKHFRSVLHPPAQERYLYLALAQRIWIEAFEQSKSQRALALRQAMLAKWLQLRGASVPTIYDTLLVDEAHDLSASWVGLLHTYKARCVMMGDPHQRWSGRISEPRLGSAKPLAMSQSLRTGQQAEKWIQNTLNYSPVRFPDYRQFRGDLNHSTRVLHAQTYDQLPDEGLCVFANCWELLESVQKLAQGQGSFFLAQASEDELKKIVRNACYLLMSAGADTFGSEEVDGCQTKEALTERLLEGGYSRVSRLFERGFTLEHLNQSLARKTSDGPKHVLTLMVHAKNVEFGKVWLSPGFFQEFNRKIPNGKKHLYGVREATHLLYLGMTRCRYELRLPGDALDKLKDIAEQRARSEKKIE